MFNNLYVRKSLIQPNSLYQSYVPILPAGGCHQSLARLMKGSQRGGGVRLWRAASGYRKSRMASFCQSWIHTVGLGTCAPDRLLGVHGHQPLELDLRPLALRSHARQCGVCRLPEPPSPRSCSETSTLGPRSVATLMRGWTVQRPGLPGNPKMRALLRQSRVLIQKTR